MLVHSISLVILLLASIYQTHASCGNKLSVTSPCVGVISWSTNIWLPDGIPCQDTIEAQVNATWGYLGFLSPQCQPVVAYKICSDFYPPCQSNNQPQPSCLSLCTAITSASACSGDQAMLANLSVTAGTTLIVPAAIPYKGTALLGARMNCTGLPSPPANCTSYPAAPFAPNITLDHCETYTGTACPNIFPGPVYVAQGTSQEYPESVLDANAWLLTSVTGACGKALPLWACSLAFASCDAKAYSRAAGINFQYEPAVASFSCDSYCSTYSEVCPSFFPLSPLLVPNCAQNDSQLIQCGKSYWPGRPHWPVSTYTFPGFVYGHDLTIDCTSTLGELGAVGSCPAPIVKPENPLTPGIFPGSICALPCPPVWQFPEEYWQKAETEFVVTAVPSLFFTTFMVVTWTVFPSKRKQTYVLCFNFCTFMIAFITCISYGFAKDIRNLPCKNNAEFHPQEDGGFCFFQGLGLFYFSLSGVFWWLVVAFHIYLTVVKQKRFSVTNKYALDVSYNIFAWGCPFLLLVIYLGCGGTFGGSINDPLLFCLFDSNSILAVQYICYYVPIGVACFVGFIFIFFIMHSLHKSAQAAKIRGSARWKRQIRPLVFVLQFFIIFFFIFFFRSESAIKVDSIRASATEWFQCLLQTQGTSNAGTCGDAPSVHLTRPIWIGLFFAIGGQGLINFLSWGTQANNFELWMALFRGKGLGSAHLASDLSTDTAPERSKNSRTSRREKGSKQKKDKDGMTRNASEMSLAAVEEKVYTVEESQKSHNSRPESEMVPMGSEVGLTDPVDANDVA